MNRVTLMEPWAVTENKVRWRGRTDAADFDCYIPKWRVPVPWPKQIIVAIREIGDTAVASKVELGEPDIVVLADRLAEHSKTVRFAPRGLRQEWEIGEPYIPAIAP
jgi:hypothetical protein